MKAFYLFVIFLFALPYRALSGNAEWRKVDSVSPEFEMYRFYEQMDCPDSMHCLIKVFTRQNDPILRLTTDGGHTWKDVYKDSTRDGDSPWAKVTSTRLNMIAFPSPKLIIAVGDSGRIIRSTDLGANWEIQTLGKDKALRQLTMLDDKYGVIHGNILKTLRNVFYETSDGGSTWSLMNMPQQYSDSAAFSEIVIIKKGLLYVKHYCMTDKSLHFLHIHGNWEIVDSYPMNNGTEGTLLYFINDKVGWGGGGGKPTHPNSDDLDYNEVIYYTNNGGKSWITQRDTFFVGEQIYNIDFVNQRFGIAGSGFGRGYYTHNGGKYWEPFQIDDIIIGHGYAVDDPQLTSYSSGYAIVDYNYIYKYTRDWSLPHDTTGSPDDSIKSISLGPPDLSNYLINYPNPFSERTTIVYNLSQAGPMSLSLYDLQGNKIETLKEEYEYEGLHEVDYDVVGLSPGCYYYQLRSGGQVLTRKMVVNY